MKAPFGLPKKQPVSKFPELNVGINKILDLVIELGNIRTELIDTHEKEKQDFKTHMDLFGDRFDSQSEYFKTQFAEKITEAENRISNLKEIIQKFNDFTAEARAVQKGDKGEPGKTPVAGVDFPFPKDGYTPIKGKDYFDGVPGVPGKDGKTPIPGIDFEIPKDGKDAIVDPQQIIDFLLNLPEGKRFTIQHIDGLEKALQVIKENSKPYLHGGGVPSLTAGSGITLTPTSDGGFIISSSGEGGTPGGLTTELQYNNAGTFGGISGVTTNGTAVTFGTDALLANNLKSATSAGTLFESNNGTDIARFGAGGGDNATFYGTLSEDGTLGTEIITNGDFTGGSTGWTLGTGWAYGTNNVVKSSNGTGTLTSTTPITVTAGTLYRLQVTVSTFTGVGGTLTITCGGVTLPALTAEATTRTHTLDFIATSTGNLSIAPSNTSRFTIDDITLKQVVGQIRSYRDTNLLNPNPATPASQQSSPALHFGGYGWKTNSVAASQAVDWKNYLLPVQGSTNPTSTLVWQSSINGGAYSNVMTLGSTSGLSVPGAGSLSERFGLNATASGTYAIAVGNNAFAGAAGVIAIGYNAQAYGGGDSTVIGRNSTATGNYDTSIGQYNTTNDSFQIAIGYNHTLGGGGSATYSGAFGSSHTIGYSHSYLFGYAMTAFADYQALFEQNDLWLGRGQSSSATAVSFHAPDIASGNTDTVGSDIKIYAGAGTGTGLGGKILEYIAPALSSGSTTNTHFETRKTESDGVTTFSTADITVLEPSPATGSIHYNDGTFTTGYSTDGVTSRYYYTYARKTVNGNEIWSSTAAYNGSFVDDNSTVSYVDTPSLETATENVGLTGYVAGDFIQYQFWGACEINGVTLYSSIGTGTSVSMTTTPAGVDLSWTPATTPTGATNARTIIMRDINGGGFVDYLETTAGATTFADDNTLWIFNTAPNTPTTVQNFYQIDLSWSGSAGADNYKVLRNDGVDTFTLTGNTGTLIDTGSLSWADSSTVTPTSSTGVVTVVNATRGGVEVGGSLVLARTSSTTTPTTADLPTDKDASIHKDTSTGNVYLAYNDGGATIKTVQLT